jgi:DNA-binding response OmpR family regulator
VNKPRVLVIDDDPSVRAAVSSALSGEGYDVDWFGDAEEALRQALAEPPAVVLLDVGMPKLDGWELCEILRRQTQTRDVPVLFLTGHADVRDRITAMQVGGSDFISKPFHARDLRTKVRALVGGEPLGGAIGRR